MLYGLFHNSFQILYKIVKDGHEQYLHLLRLLAWYIKDNMYVCVCECAEKGEDGVKQENWIRILNF